MKNKDILICSCHSTEHQYLFLYDEDEDSKKIKHPICYVHVHLNKRPLWERIIYGVKYIFGRQCNYGAFDEFIFNPDDIPKVENLLKHLKNEKN
jgi:hypothetical protein